MVHRSSSATPVSLTTALPSYVDVVLPRRLHRPFTYLIPDELKGKVEVGQAVVVPFGTQALHGLVIAVYFQPPFGAPTHGLKALSSLADGSSDLPLTSGQIALSRWVADRYAAPWGQCIKLVLPPTTLRTPVQPRYILTEPPPNCLSSTLVNDEMERRLLKRLSRYSRGLTEKTLVQADKAHVMPVLQALVSKGLIVRDMGVTPQVAYFNEAPAQKKEAVSGHANLKTCIDPPIEAASWPTTLDQAISRNSFIALLVHARYEIRLWCLIQAVRATRRRGRAVLIITGDVESANRLTAALVGIGEQPLQLHSGVSVKNRAAVWSTVRQNSTPIVVGTRMAVFAPVEKLGLVWVEGEDDGSLKEEQVPHYHAREVAKHRAACDQALLVLASSHPSLEGWSAVQQGEMMACVYRDRVTSTCVNVIDLKGHARTFPTDPLLTPLLCDGLREALRQQAPAFVYLNRKGFATVLHCRDCGAMPRCDACSVTLTFYKRGNHLRCHFCGRTKPVPDHCMECRSLKLEPVGSGTERLEETVRRMFPQARVARVDGETIRRPSDARAFHRLLTAGEVDIVIGTQKLFHLGLQGQAAFVAVPDADGDLHIPDFRSGERMHQHLVDAVELARPAQAGGVVAVQTRFTDHHAIMAIAQGEASLFVEAELILRRMLHYPPYSQLVKLDVSGSREPVVAQAAARWARLLREQSATVETRLARGSRPPAPSQPLASGSGEMGETVILGPSPAPHARARGRHHWQILMKVMSLEAGRDLAIRTMEVLERGPRPGALRFDIDVDPITMG
jgi:primosomal protein N' (replication factor Y)